MARLKAKLDECMGSTEVPYLINILCTPMHAGNNTNLPGFAAERFSQVSRYDLLGRQDYDLEPFWVGVNMVGCLHFSSKIHHSEVYMLTVVTPTRTWPHICQFSFPLWLRRIIHSRKEQSSLLYPEHDSMPDQTTKSASSSTALDSATATVRITKSYEMDCAIGHSSYKKCQPSLVCRDNTK